MKNKKREHFFSKSRFQMILLSAIFFFLMFPTVIFGFKLPDLGFLAWVHLVPLLVVMNKRSFKFKFVSSFFMYFLGFSAAMYWVMIALYQYGGLSLPMSLLAFGLVMMIIALLQSLPLAVCLWIRNFNRLPLFIILPLFLITRDFLIEFYPLGGFPWGVAAYSQGQWLPFFQWVDTVGFFGLSFYIYLVNGLLAEGLISFFYEKQLDKLVSRVLVVFVLVLCSLFSSFLSSRHFEKSKQFVGELQVGLIQANIAQDVKWDRYKASDHLFKYLRLSSFAVKNGAELLIWPETAYPYAFYEYQLEEEQFLDRQEMTVPLLLGAVIYRKTPQRLFQYNSTLLINQEARFVSAYYKMHLVPFGEYLPFAKYLDFLGSLSQNVGTFDEGTDGYKLFPVQGFQFASLICFEDVFFTPSLDNARGGAHVFINFTNDAWYAQSSAQYQHLVFSQFRALENRRPLLRATNTGYTAVISPKGEVIDKSEPFTEAYLLHKLKIENMTSYFTKYGSKWLWPFLIFTGLVFLYTVLKRFLGPVKISE